MGDWLTIIIVLLILGILLDGWRRMRRAHRESLKVSPALRKGRGGSAPQPTKPDNYSAELPNGGARVAYREQLAAQARADKEPGTAPEQIQDEARDGHPAAESKTPSSRRREGQIPEQVTLNLDESVPILMETTDDESEPDQAVAADRRRIEPTLGEAVEPPGKPDKAHTKTARHKAGGAELSGSQTHAAGAQTSTPESSNNEAQAPEEVLIVNIMAPNGQAFRGDVLLEALLQGGMRFGDMNIFHRYQTSGGGGAILFSLANIVKPGTFDLNQMDNFTTPGVSLFMTLPLEASDSTNTQIFDLMLKTAQDLAQELGGDLKDENRSVMTRQTMEHCRQRIHEFERKQLFRSGV